MLELRPTCEHCNGVLAPESALARICLRISAIVDACFRLIVDGKSVLPLTRRGSTQVLS